MSLYKKILCITISLISLFSLCFADATKEHYPLFLDENLVLYISDDWEVLYANNLNYISSVGDQQYDIRVEDLDHIFEENKIRVNIVLPSGDQFVLKLLDREANYNDTEIYKENRSILNILDFLKEEYGNFSEYYWMENGYLAFFKEDYNSEFYMQVFSTILHNKIIIWEHPAYKNAFNSESEDDKVTMLSQLAFLGIEEEIEVDYTTHLNPFLSSVKNIVDFEAAEIVVRRENTPIIIDYAPQIWNQTILPLTGTTEPNASMRYYIDGVGYKRFDADEVGNFDINITGIKAGSNNINIQSIGENGYGNIAFKVDIKWEYTPFELFDIPEDILGDELVLRGFTLPNSKISLNNKNTLTDGHSDEKGFFSFNIPLRLGVNHISLSILADGYKKSIENINITRTKEDLNALEDFKSNLENINYMDLVENPIKYKDKKTSINGDFIRFFSPDMKPGFIVSSIEENQLYFVESTYVKNIDNKKSINLFCYSLGENVLNPITNSFIPRLELFHYFD